MRRQQFQLMRGKLLPSLDVIGRSYAVEDETAVQLNPDFDCALNPEEKEDETVYRYTLSDAEQCSEILSKIFAKKNAEMCLTKEFFAESTATQSFIHSPSSVNLVKSYINLTNLLEHHAVLNFSRDIIVNIKSLSVFVQTLEHIVCEEHRCLDNIRHNNHRTFNLNSKIFDLSAYCEELRMHITAWNHIKQKWQNNSWLSCAQRKLTFSILSINQKWVFLQSQSIRWLSRLIEIGLDIFSNSDLELISLECLWDVAKGIQDYNNIVKSLKCSSSLLGNKPLGKVFHYICSDSSESTMYFIVSNKMSEVSLLHILSKISYHRSKRAALRTYHFFTENQEVVDLFRKGLVPFLLESNSSGYVKPVRPTLTDNQYTFVMSDYDSSNGNIDYFNDMMHRIGDFGVSGMSQEMCPLLEFIEHEQEFIIQLVSAISNSTTFLHSNGPMRGTLAEVSANKYVESSSPPVSNRRKCVSWGDTADINIQSKIIGKYVEFLWNNFTSDVISMFHSCSWNLDEDFALIELGSVAVCDDIVPRVLRCMIEHVIVKDLFPAESLGALMKVANHLHTYTVFTSWDLTLCSVLPLLSLDKCQPCLNTNSEYSTKCCILLQVAIKSLSGFLTSFIDAKQPSSNGHFHAIKPNLSDIVAIYQKLKFTYKLTNDWCSTKLRHCILETRIGQYLFVLQTDLKILLNEVKISTAAANTFQQMYVLKNVSCGFLESSYVSHISAAQRILEAHRDDLNALSVASINRYTEFCKNSAQLLFPEIMPLGKMWRRNAGNVSEANDYVSHAMEQLLEPSINAVSKLSENLQTPIVTIATNATCEAWLECILKNKIKFSISGVQQLAADFSYARMWLAAAIHHRQVRESVLGLLVFRRMYAAVTLLQQQPRRKGDADLQSSESSFNLMTSYFGAKDQFANDKSQNDIDELLSCVDNDQWLSLRLNTSHRWKIMGCLNSRETTV